MSQLPAGGAVIEEFVGAFSKGPFQHESSVEWTRVMSEFPCPMRDVFLRLEAVPMQTLPVGTCPHTAWSQHSHEMLSSSYSTRCILELAVGISSRGGDDPRF